ncbi:SEC-C domain-containing protein [Pontibacillus salipaludis]|uniref:SEC-C domain-containing protein n=1 Tax=Pontibacillus salipaludis TaxID=1697394 RepID=UPI0031F0FB81
MTVGRNDLCHCGSGKKYKKCCMQKNEQQEVYALKEERFHEQKEQLVYAVERFLMNQVSSDEIRKLEREFTERAEHKRKDAGFAMFWRIFFLRYENGLRGIEWFWESKRHALRDEMKEMAERWVKLRPRLLMAVDLQEDVIVYEDIHTKEQFPCAKENQGPDCIAWNTTIGLLEPMVDRYYFNGLRGMYGPEELRETYDKVQSWMKDEGISYEETLRRYYPEILASLNGKKSPEKNQEALPVTEFTYIYDVVDPEVASALIHNEPEFTIDHRDELEMKFSWTKNWQEYTDSEAPGVVRIADEYASFTWNRVTDTITMMAFHLRYVNPMLRKMMESDGAIMLREDREKHLGDLPGAIYKRQSLKVEYGTPKLFGTLAQQRRLIPLDDPILLYGNRSLREVVEQGEDHLAERWLKRSENQSHVMLWNDQQDLSVTPDYSAVRRELGLPLSPFVTSRESRRTTLESIESHDERETIVIEAEVPYYEDLGFTDETKNAFYARDLVRFYREKVDGKSDSTKRKYKKALYAIRGALERKGSYARSWEELGDVFWTEDLFEDEEVQAQCPRKFQATEFSSVVKMLLKWLRSKELL